MVVVAVVDDASVLVAVWPGEKVSVVVVVGASDGGVGDGRVVNSQSLAIAGSPANSHLR
jgi:hypothetical protein